MGDGPTRVELLNHLAHRLNKTPPPLMDPATETRLASYLNQRHRRVVSMPGMARLRDATITFTSVVGQADYGLPNLAKIARIFETTNERTLYEMSLQNYRLIRPLPLMGTPEAYVWRGRSVVAQQPVTGLALTVVSSAPAEVTGVHVEGVTDTNAPRKASVALDGTTPVALPVVARVDKFYLDAPCSGDVTLADGAVVLGVIPSGQILTTYAVVTLYSTPSAVFPYYVDIKRAITDLVHDTDEAVLPVDFADVLVLGALADEYQHLADPRWSTAIMEYKERERQLQYWIAETEIGQPLSLLGPSRQRHSQLGPWFPAGS